MKYLLENLKEVEKALKTKKDIGLFLDFDGTLASIVLSPEKARLPEKVNEILVSLQKKPQFFLAVVSGRMLENIKKRINIEGITYAGNHGLEWEIEGQKKSVVIDEKIIQAMSQISKELKKLETFFKGVFVEDKRLTIGVHYRLLTNDLKEFKKAFAEIIKPYLSGHKLTVIKGKKILDIRPDINWTKGHFLAFLIGQISKKTKAEMIPIYIGDDKTDEDVFAKLKNGITVKVGKSFESKAKYYLKNTEEVLSFLQWINER